MWPAIAAAGVGGLLGLAGQSSANKASKENAEYANTPRVWDAADAQTRGMLGDMDSIYQQGGFAAGPTAPELQGREQQYDYAQGPLQGMVGATQGAWGQQLSGGLNPYVPQMIQAAQNDLMQDYRSITAPQREIDALGAGQYGGSRQAVGQSIDRRNLMDNMSDISTGMLNNAWNQSQASQANAIGQAGNVAAMGLMPGSVTQDIGNQYRQDQLVPGQNIQGYAATIAPWSTPSTGGAMPQTGSLMGGAVGGGLLGGGLYNQYQQYQQQPGYNPGGYGNQGGGVYNNGGYGIKLPGSY